MVRTENGTIYHVALRAACSREMFPMSLTTLISCTRSLSAKLTKPEKNTYQKCIIAAIFLNDSVKFVYINLMNTQHGEYKMKGVLEYSWWIILNEFSGIRICGSQHSVVRIFGAKAEWRLWVICGWCLLLNLAHRHWKWTPHKPQSTQTFTQPNSQHVIMSTHQHESESYVHCRGIIVCAV